MAELITLPSLAMSPMAFSLMASDLHLASQAWLRAVASCSRDARNCSSSAWTYEGQARTRSHRGHPSDGENLKTSKFALQGLVSLVIK
jgi:hypothetical protein